MKKSLIFLMAIMLVSLTGCDFLRTIAGRPTSRDMEERRMAVIRAEEEALQSRMDSIRLAGEKVISDSLAILDNFRAAGVTVSTSDKIGGLSGTGLEYRYYIIVGAFRESVNARKIFNAASEKGYSPVLLNCRGGMIAVGLAPANKLQDIEESYNALKQESFCPKEAWILVNE